MKRAPRIPGTSRERATLFVLPAIPDDLEPAQKNALALRNQASVTGVCPDCGATPSYHRDTHGIGHLTFLHEPWCAALTDGAAA